MLRRFVFGSTVVAAGGIAFWGGAPLPHASAAEATKRPGEFQPTLPMFTAEEVYAQRDPAKGKVYVSYRHGVYDVTKFLEEHPGGEKVLLAAGTGLEAFWKVYPQHNTPEVYEVLESMRIGNLKDATVAVTPTQSDEQIWANEPTRNPAFTVLTKRPFNAETNPSILHSKTTPNELFFVRNHLPVPLVTDEKSFHLEIGGRGLKRTILSVDDLKEKFPKHTITSVVQCSGNRRSEVAKVGTVRGLGWTTGGVGCAEWSGARLRDVLLYAGMDPKAFPANHIIFEGLDKDPFTLDAFSVSIPADKATSELGDTLIAYEMNGEPIPRDHGYPLRAVVPGTVGARQCKWLSKITASDKESQGIYQQKDYKGFAPGTSMDGSMVPAIQELPVQSAITEPSPDSEHHGSVPIKGWAWSGGGRAISRVDLTTDGGKTWSLATLNRPEGQIPNRTWAWTLFDANVKIPVGLKEGDKFEVCSRAVDSAMNVQPEKPIYHIRGMLNNQWHCLKYTVSS